MAKIVDAHCPGDDPTRGKGPETLSCPKHDCDGEVEIWPDEKAGKCTKCKEAFPRDALGAS